MPPAADDQSSQTRNTPLPPSVEKAYYRKCIELKRRLTEVEKANEQAKIRRTRLDRGIMKMRLERAFLLDEMRKRMDVNVDGSDGSGEEGLATPPPDRPHRDKRRRHLPPAASGPGPSTSYNTIQTQPAPYGATPTAVPVSQVVPSSETPYPPSRDISTPQQPQETPTAAYTSTSAAPIPASPYGSSAQTNGNNVEERDGAPANREAGVMGDALSAGPAIKEDVNGERRIASSSSADAAGASTSVEKDSGVFTSVNP